MEFFQKLGFSGGTRSLGFFGPCCAEEVPSRLLPCANCGYGDSNDLGNRFRLHAENVKNDDNAQRLRQPKQARGLRCACSADSLKSCDPWNLFSESYNTSQQMRSYFVDASVPFALVAQNAIGSDHEVLGDLFIARQEKGNAIEVIERFLDCMFEVACFMVPERAPAAPH